jgi:hypothetical protein
MSLRPRFPGFLGFALYVGCLFSKTYGDDYNVQISSLDSRNSSSINNLVTRNLWYANSFSINTGANNNGVVNSLYIALAPTDFAQSTSLRVSVYDNMSDSRGDMPNNSIGEFVYNSSLTYPGTVRNAGYELTGGLKLADAKYWFVVSTDKDVSASWLKMNQRFNMESAYASIMPEIVARDNATGLWNSVSSGDQMMRFAINTPVPEPSTMILGSIVAVCLGLTAYCKSRFKKVRNVV